MPSKWNPRRLKEFASLTRGLSYDSAQLTGEGSAFITIKCFEKGGGFRAGGLKTYSGPRPTDLELHGGELLIANTDLTREASIVGAPALAPVCNNGPAYFSMDVSRVTLDHGLADERFLFYRMLSADVRSFMQARSSGTTVLHLQTREVPDLRLELPPVDEQRRIAAIVDTLDDAIRRTEQVVAKLQQMKQGLLHDLLTRGVDEQGHLRPSPKDAPHLYKDSALGWIPNGWDVDKLSMRFAVKGGKRLPAGHNYSEVPTRFRYLRVLDFFGRRVSFDQLEYLHESTFSALQHYEIAEPDLFISIAGSLGFVGVYHPPRQLGHRTILTENAARLVAWTDARPEFVALQMNHSRVQQQIEIQKGTGGGVPKLALFRIENLLLAWPPLEEQQRVESMVEAIELRVAEEARDLAKLSTLKRGLLHDLLTGRVRVRLPVEVSV